MYIRHFILASIAFFAVTTSALPTPPTIALSRSEDNHLVSRDETYDFNDLQRRLLTNQQLAQHVTDTLQAQANKKAGNAPLPKTGPKLSSAERQQVKAALQTAGANHRNTVNLPNRKGSYSVDKDNWSGKEVRQGIFNSHLFGGSTPLSSSYPKTFGNRPYPPNHSDPSLAGKRVLPGAPKVLKEFPVISGSSTGWTGKGIPGPGRVITSQTPNGQTMFQGVVGHNPTAGGTLGDHYKAKHNKQTPAKPDYSGLESLFGKA